MSDSNETWTHNRSVRKQTLNHLAKLVVVVVIEQTGGGNKWL